MPNSLSFTEPGLDRAWRLSSIGRLQSAIALLDELRRGGELEGGTPAAELVWLRAFLALATGRHDEAMRDAGDAIELFDTLGDPERRGMAVALLVWAATIVGDAPAIDEAFASLDCVDPDGVAACWLQNTIAIASWSAGEHDHARMWGHRACMSAERLGDDLLLGRWLNNAALALLAQGDVTEAVAMLERAASLSERMGDLWNLRVTLCNLAETCAETGRTDEADTHLIRAEATAWSCPDELSGRERLIFDEVRGTIRLGRGELALAIASLGESVALALRMNDLEIGTGASRKLAGAYADSGDYERAYRESLRSRELWERRANIASRRAARVAGIRLRTEELARRAASLQSDNQILSEEARRLAAEAERDPLTGLRNRRGLRALLQGLGQAHATVALAMVDIDHFKRINDEHSHAVGDEVIREVAATLAAAARPGHAFRLGGEEFLAILVDLAPGEAALHCERVRHAVETHRWGHGLRVTVSIGFAFARGGMAPHDMLREADARLYEAKRSGRNRVAGAAPAPVAA